MNESICLDKHEMVVDRDHYEDLIESLVLVLEGFDALLPGAKYIAVDIGLLNTAAIKGRRMVESLNQEQ